MATRPEVVERVNAAVDELDSTIRDIRGAIFQLRAPVPTSRCAPRCASWSTASVQPLGFRPVVHLDGPVDSVVPDEVRADLLAVVREALSNVVRHAAASRVEVRLSVRADRVVLSVVDNGRGGAEESGGLRNLRGRAERLNGECEVVDVLPSGNSLTWASPSSPRSPILKGAGSRGGVSSFVELDGEDGGLGAPFQAQLVEQARDVVLDRLLGQEHLRGDLPVGQPVGDVIQDPALLLGQGLELLGQVLRVADALQHPLGDRRVQQRLSGRDPPHPVDQIGAADLLEHVARGPGHDGGEQRLVVLVRGQDQALDRRVDRADLPADVDAAAVGQPGVEHRDVGPQRRDPGGRLLRRTGLADHLDVALALQQLTQAAPDHLVVVEQEDSDHAFSLPGNRARVVGTYGPGATDLTALMNPAGQRSP